MKTTILYLILSVIAGGDALAQATWVIRLDGGTRYSTNTGAVPGLAGQCDGLADAAYPGQGVNQHCAWSDVRNLVFDGSYSPTENWVIKGGDTVLIHAGQYRCGRSDSNGGVVDPLGLAIPGNPYASCFSGIPSGTAANPTQIVGDGSATTQIFGGFGAWSVFDLSGSGFVTITGIELTRHSQCTIFGVPAVPGNCSKSTPLDDYATNGIVTGNSTHDIVLNDVDIHGFPSRGIIGPIGGTITAKNVRIAFNGGAGWDFDDGSKTPSANGLINLSGVTVEWNGCNQNYPGTGAISCYGQNDGGYGDGIGTPPGTCISANVDTSTFRYNTQDGPDFLHNDTGNCTLSFTNSQSYGNLGAQLKIGPAFTAATVTNNLFVGNCLRLSAAFTGNAPAYNANLGGGDYCRANDVLPISVYSNNAITVMNNTIVTYEPVTFDFICSDPANSGPASAPVNCANSKIVLQNNIVRAYSNPNLSYNGNGAPAGYCVTGCNGTTVPIGTITRTNNVYFGLANFTPAATETVADPLFVGEPMGTGAAFTEAELDNFNFTLAPGSPATGMGATSTVAAPPPTTITVPTITWAPATLTVTSALSPAQLNAVASTLGTYVYSPPSGVYLPIGKNTLSVTFIPTDTAHFKSVTQTQQIVVQVPAAVSVTCTSAIVFGKISTTCK